MSDMNCVSLIGRLACDALLAYNTLGTARTKITLAVNRTYKRAGLWEKEVSYFDVMLWGKNGESLARYLTKGTQVSVEGQLRQHKWEYKGKTYSEIEIRVNQIGLLGSPRREAAQAVQEASGAAEGEEPVIRIGLVR